MILIVLKLILRKQAPVRNLVTFDDILVQDLQDDEELAMIFFLHRTVDLTLFDQVGLVFGVGGEFFKEVSPLNKHFLNIVIKLLIRHLIILGLDAI